MGGSMYDALQSPRMAEAKINSRAHMAGLKRLSERANAGAFPSPTQRVHGREIIQLLSKSNMVQISKGLSDEEFERIEGTFGFIFPPDLKALLREGMPLGPGFPDWRSGGLQQLRTWINFPTAGLCSLAEKGKFWSKQWGSRPNNLKDAISVAAAALKKSPVLVPIYGHCYVSSSPDRPGNPVFFIYEQYVFCCGRDVTDFFRREAFYFQTHDPAFELPAFIGGSRIGVSLRRCLSTEGRVGKEEAGPGLGLGMMDRCRSVPSGTRDSVAMGQSWGRNLDALARSPDTFVKSVVSNNVLIRSLEECHRISGIRPQLSTVFSPSQESTGNIRRIEFWSDFLHLNQALDSDLEEKKTMPELNWVAVILEDVAARLRNGGWKDEDISEMLAASAPLCGFEKEEDFGRQSLLVRLALQLDMLSSLLRKAGWSVEEVKETLFFEEKKQRPITPFAASFAQA